MASSIPQATDREWCDQIAGYTLYAELLTAAAPTTYSQKSSLTLASGGNYSSKTLANVTASNDGTTAAKVTADNPLWSGLTIGTGDIVAIAICRRAGGSPASTDRVICVMDLDSAYTPNGADFTFVFPSTGFFKTRP
jgi:hypothetical protein